MNRKAKIAIAAVSVVMAGTMALSVAGCHKNDNNGGKTYGDEIRTATDKATTSAQQIVDKLNDANGSAKLASHVTVKQNAYGRLKTYSANGASSTEGKQDKLNVVERDTTVVDFPMDIGDNAERSVSYTSKLLTSDGAKLPDGKTYHQKDIKPAWQHVATQLNLNIKEAYTDKGDSKGKIEKLGTSVAEGQKLQDRIIVTDSIDQINQRAGKTGEWKLLDLSNYLEEMPNYKAFLEQNDIVQLSLTADTNTGAMYAAPYFDGFDDIEKYVLCKTNWVEALLDNTTGGDTVVTFRKHANEKQLDTTSQASITSYMGTTSKYNTEVLDKDGNKVNAGIDVNYDEALKAAKSSTAELGKAVSEAAGKAYDGTSGNIVDIQNFVINEKQGDVTGAQLLKITQEYIKVAYCVGGTTTSFYTQSGYKLSDVFNGNSAAWDVDLYAAIGRCLVTNPSLIKSGSDGNTIDGEGATALADLYLCANRQDNMQRMIDTTSFVGELYGIRGLEARNLYSYIDANGQLQDPRANTASYEAFKAFHNFYLEGLVSDSGSGNNGQTSYHSAENKVEAMTYHDYSNTQTPAGFELDGAVAEGTYPIEEGYNFTSIFTPVSKWNDGAAKYMRFTESWRSVKDTGFAVPYDAVKDSPQKLAAVLEFIDYMFSPDGQIELTYGPMADNKEGANGFWWNPEVPAGTTVAADGSVEVGGHKYKATFTFKGKTYASDIRYNGKGQPTVTDSVKQLYYGNDVNGMNVSKSSAAKGWQQSAGCARDYTAFARYVLGTATNLGNKLQSFEYQMTSQMGISGAERVSNAIDKGIIKHVVPTMSGVSGNTWYACVPTLLPYDTNEKATNTASIKVSNHGKDGYFSNDKNVKTNLYWEIIRYGYDASKYAAAFDNIGLSKS